MQGSQNVSLSSKKVTRTPYSAFYLQLGASETVLRCIIDPARIAPVRIAVASLMQESNTFSTMMTRHEDFNPVFGPAAFQRHRGKLTEMGGFIDALSRKRHEIVPLCAAWAITANRTRRADFRRLVDEFSARLARVLFDGLLLAMHGAQTAEGVDDVEGHVLMRAREIVGPVLPIVVTLDLHANITQTMIDRATALVGYHTYPHTDMYEIGQKAAMLLLSTLSGAVRPVMAWRKLPLLVNAENHQTCGDRRTNCLLEPRRWRPPGVPWPCPFFPCSPGWISTKWDRL
jgi:microcystin degradation protein MlrC